MPVIPMGVEPVLTPRAALAQTHSPAQQRAGKGSLNKSKVRPKDASSVLKPSSDGEDSSVRVAVRVRPFSKRYLPHEALNKLFRTMLWFYYLFAN